MPVFTIEKLWLLQDVIREVYVHDIIHDIYVVSYYTIFISMQIFASLVSFVVSTA